MAFFTSSSWKGQGDLFPTIPRCGQCGLAKLCRSPKMAPEGAGRLPILFVGDCPGENDDRRGEHFTGDAGQVLRTLLGDLRVNLDDCWMTNAAICRPPKGELEDLHIESCRPNLANTIRRLQPRVIVPLGHEATKALVAPEWGDDVGPVARWVGWTIPSGAYQAWVCPTYHPQFLLQQREDPVLLRIVKQHLRNALELARAEYGPAPESMEDIRKRVELIPDPRKMRLRMKDLASKRGRLALDYETTGLKPERAEQEIYTCSFCYEGEDTFAGLITPDNHAELSEVLRSAELLKIASNLKFEERWTRKKLGHGVAMWWWDTMLGAHYLDNRRGITSIKFQAYVHLGVGEYADYTERFLKGREPNALNDIKRAPVQDVLLYNGIDSKVEFDVAVLQRRQVYGAADTDKILG